MHRVYFANIKTISQQELDNEYQLLNSADKAKVDRIKSEDGKKRTITGRMLARNAVAQYEGKEKNQISFSCSENGKPYVFNSSTSFSISHCRDLVVCVADNSEIGIDIEYIRPVKSGFIYRVCTHDERLFVYGSCYNLNNGLVSDKSVLRRFFTVWTLKEAYFKCIGTGINNLKSVDVLKDIKCKSSYSIGDYIISIVLK